MTLMPSVSNTTRWRGLSDYSFVFPAPFTLAQRAFAACESLAFAAALILRLAFLTGAAAVTGLPAALALRLAHAAFILAEVAALAAVLLLLSLG